MKLTETRLKKIIKEEIQHMVESKYKIGDAVVHDTDDLGHGKVIAVEPGKKGNILVKWPSGVRTHHRWALKPAKTVTEGKPYRGISRRGRTESQAQQKAAGMAWGCRKKRGEERKKCAKKLKSYGGAAWDLYSDEITNPELKRLATIRGGAEIPEKDAKPGDKLKSLPKKITKKD